VQIKKSVLFFIKSLHISIYCYTFVPSIIKTNKDMNTKYMVLVGSSYICELIITEEIARMCYHCGICDNEVKIAKDIPLIKEQLDTIDEDLMRKVIGEILGEETANAMDIEDLKEWIVFEASALLIDGDFNEYND
jgi:hypothetical protein